MHGSANLLMSNNMHYPEPDFNLSKNVKVCQVSMLPTGSPNGLFGKILDFGGILYF